MTEPSQRYNLRTLRELLQTAFSVEDLRGLFSFAMHADLRPVADQFTPEDSKPAMVRKAVRYCQSRYLLDELVAEIQDANPRAYTRFEPELLITGIEQPAEEAPTKPAPEILTITSPIYLDLVRIPAGEFRMGSVATQDKDASEEEFPPHRVHVPEFHIGLYPVTYRQYQAFVKATGSPAPWTWVAGFVPLGKGNHPVAGIEWRDAVQFCAWLSEETGQSFRLPTEAEWEKAARGTDGRIWPWGDEPPDESHCNFGHRSGGDTTSIGRYSPQGDSFYGCADMAGNVYEWCHSLYKPYPYRARDGREADSGDEDRVLRGGAYWSEPADLRCAYRVIYIPGYGSNLNGFRVARGLLEAAP